MSNYQVQHKAEKATEKVSEKLTEAKLNAQDVGK